MEIQVIPIKSSTRGFILTAIPITVKMTEVVVGMVCSLIAGYDIIAHLIKISTHGLVLGANDLLGGALAKVPFIGPKFVDQLTCRIFFIVVTPIFAIISFIQLIWFRPMLYAGSLTIEKISCLVCHLVGAALSFAVSYNLLDQINFLKHHFYNEELMRAAAIMGFIIAGCYLLSTFLDLCFLVASRICCRKFLNTGHNII